MNKTALQQIPQAPSERKGLRMLHLSEALLSEHLKHNPDNPFFPGLNEDENGEERPFNACLEADLYAVKSVAGCPQCGRPNVVITLGASPEPYELPCDEFKFFIFFGITELPSSVVKSLQAINPNYGLRSDSFTKELQYLNACAVCEYIFNDEDLRVEPGDAFLPLVVADYERIQLIDIGHSMDYQLLLDEDEDRISDGIEARCWNPAPDLWQVIVEQQEI